MSSCTFTDLDAFESASSPLLIDVVSVSTEMLPHRLLNSSSVPWSFDAINM